MRPNASGNHWWTGGAVRGEGKGVSLAFDLADVVDGIGKKEAIGGGDKGCDGEFGFADSGEGLLAVLAMGWIDREPGDQVGFVDCGQADWLIGKHDPVEAGIADMLLVKGIDRAGKPLEVGCDLRFDLGERNVMQANGHRTS